ncbi:MAG TPA: SirB2 family protein [Telluria sp.]|nr:SirB2 family protein [Telluria sp.]
MDYLTLKHFHMTCAAASGSFFFVRGLWMLAGSDMLGRRWVKVVPHVVDSLLLASAIWLAVWAHWLPTEQPWLLAKIIGLLVYIGLGTVALKRGKTLAVRASAFVLALLTFAYIASAAITKSALPFV